MSSVMETIVRGNAKFTNDLFQKLVEKDATNNVVCSPISIHAILSLIYQGAKNTTQSELAKVLSLPEVEKTAEGYKEIMKELNNASEITLHMANKIFTKKSFQINNNFKKVAENNYFSELDQVDFNDSRNSAKIINDWVEEKTNKKIQQLVTEDMIDSSTVMILINAIYFNSNWKKPFDLEDTEKRPFYLSKYKTVDVDMMSLNSYFAYGADSDLNARILKLPYKNRDVNMFIILPEEIEGLTKVIEKITAEKLISLDDKLSTDKIIINIPKFKFASKIQLKDMLSKMGLGVIFSNEANFDNMLENRDVNIKVSDVVQKAFIEVNETGTEAAAATAVQFMSYCAMDRGPPPPPFIVDRPFIFSIMYKKSILFLGQVLHPSYND